MTLETMNKATALFNKAQEAVATDPALASRVDRARLSLDHQWLLRYADYRRAAERKGLPFLGPADLDSGIDAFAARGTGQGIKKTYNWENKKEQDLKGFLEQTRASGKQRTVTSLLSEDKVFEGFLDGKIPPLPAALADKSGVIQVQDNELNVLKGAKLMLDEKACNHAAAWHDPATPNWSVQSPHAGELGLDGSWRVFVEVRVEASPGSEGTAFAAGIHDRDNKKSLSQIAPGLNPASASPAHPTASTADPRDGNYHLYDLGSHTLGENAYVWVGTVGTDAAGTKVSVNPQSVQGIFVDRILFVPESRSETAPASSQLPEKFRSLKQDKVFDFTANLARNYVGKTVKDPEAESGLTARLEFPTVVKTDKHPVDKYKLPMSWGVYGQATKTYGTRAVIKPEEVPGPGYNWYRCGKAIVIAKSYYLFFFWSWCIQFDLDSVLNTQAPDASYEIWARIKFEGPAFPHGKPEQKNAICVERVVLVRTDAVPAPAP
jgi:hypothetical protein